MMSSISCGSIGRQGIHKFFITDDNFARNKEWEAIFDRLISSCGKGTGSRWV